MELCTYRKEPGWLVKTNLGDFKRSRSKKKRLFEVSYDSLGGRE